MTRRSFVMLSATPLAGIITGRHDFSIQTLIEREVLRRFHESIHHYIALRQMAERHATLLSIRDLRPNAQMGDIFSTEVTMLFRQRVRAAMDEGCSALDAIAAQAVTPGERPNVNDGFARAFAMPVPTPLLITLPALPSELRYWFVGHDLVLVDADANLVVDVLVDAIEPFVPIIES